MGRFISTPQDRDSSSFKNCMLFSRTSVTECFVVPPGVCRLRVHTMGAGGTPCFAWYWCGTSYSQCFAYTNCSISGGAGGGYAMKYIAVTPGQVIPVTVGSGGFMAVCLFAGCCTWGCALVCNAKGGTSSFGSYLSATGGGDCCDIGCGVDGHINRCGGIPSLGSCFCYYGGSFVLGYGGSGGSGGGYSENGRNATGKWPDHWCGAGCCCVPNVTRGGDGSRVRVEQIAGWCSSTASLVYGLGGGAQSTQCVYFDSPSSFSSYAVGQTKSLTQVLGYSSPNAGYGLPPHPDDLGRESGGAGGGNVMQCQSFCYGRNDGSCGSGSGGWSFCCASSCNLGNGPITFNCVSCIGGCNFWCRCGVFRGSACRESANQHQIWTGTCNAYGSGTFGFGGNGTVLVEW